MSCVYKCLRIKSDWNKILKVVSFATPALKQQDRFLPQDTLKSYSYIYLTVLLHVEVTNTFS